MDHDKVLVRMDGSRRLTTRNRRFVKQILSTPDLPDRELIDVPSGPVQTHDSSQVVVRVEDEVTTAWSHTENTYDVSNLVDMEQYQSGARDGV